MIRSTVSITISVGPLLKRGSAAAQSQHSGLIAHNQAVGFRAAVQMNVERMAPIRMGDGTDHGEAADPVE